jgi:hypothetical protein
MSNTSRRRSNRASHLARAVALSGASGKVYPADRATQLLEAIIEPGDRVAIEGDNQKQADFLAAALAKADPGRLHDHLGPSHRHCQDTGHRAGRVSVNRCKSKSRLPCLQIDEGRDRLRSHAAFMSLR